MIIVSNHGFYEEWKKKIRDYLLTNVPSRTIKTHLNAEKHFLAMNDKVEYLMENKFYSELDQFGGIEAATIGASFKLHHCIG